MTDSSDRLDRVEKILEQFTIASNERMTRFEQESNERMTRFEQQLEQSRAESNERLTRAEQLAESNSRAIQALTDDLATFRFTVEEDRENTLQEREELRRATLGIANLLSSLDEDRPTILRKLNNIENKVDRLLERRENVE